MEFKKVANLLNDGMSINDVRVKNQEENLFSASSTDRTAMIMNTVAVRIEILPDTFIYIWNIEGQQIMLKRLIGR
ncbi:MAG: DUF1819 family protein [Lachnospiraceae bacterium]|nr:DUF1819 family protein [Lachnospiraceae bacterium]